jgi:uncharacterized protein
MNRYVDASVVLRRLLGQPGALASWDEIEGGLASRLMIVECMRALDRLAVRGHLTLAQAGDGRTAVHRIATRLSIVEPGRRILDAASGPFPTPLGTLDAIHLATAIALRDDGATDLDIATHDAELATAARAMGFEAVGA